MELGCGSFVEMEWSYFFFYYLFYFYREVFNFKYSMPGPNQHIFLFYSPQLFLSQAWAE